MNPDLDTLVEDPQGGGPDTTGRARSVGPFVDDVAFECFR